MIAVNGAHLAGPAVFDAEHTFGLGLVISALCRIEDHRLMPKNGFVAEPGFVRVAPGSGVSKVTAGFGLPPGVDDRAIALANHVIDTSSKPRD